MGTKILLSATKTHHLPSGGSHRVKNQTSLILVGWEKKRSKSSSTSEGISTPNLSHSAQIFASSFRKWFKTQSNRDFYVMVFKWHILAGRKLHMKAWRVQNAVCCWLYIFNDPPRIIYESFSSPAVLDRLTLTACDVINHPSKMLCVPL